ncbi:MAG: SDR family NAD(P)-dependent oxidoreductase, partial [Planctomycetaceae bacterium]|nr:SDR family NAD(P)-dependent oxidoreductase [Planctomycetaceae bacterium]
MSASFLQSLFGLDGLTAVVIGGTGTLGGAFCDALAGAGAHVLVVGRDEVDGNARVTSIKNSGGSAEFFRADSTKREDLEAIVAH